ncbi:MAG: glycosyltransferase [Planctomyces sp.]|nr:glycosyltransferase [Planctomyces sp.]
MNLLALMAGLDEDATTAVSLVMCSYLGLLTAKSWLALNIIRQQRQLLSKYEAELGDSEHGQRRSSTLSTPVSAAVNVNILTSVSVVQPILSGDPLLREKLWENVEALPKSVQFLWLVDETDPEGQRIAEELRAKHQNVRVMLCEESPPTVNPKTFKLDKALRDCSTTWFVVLDDDTVITPQSLIHAEAHLRNGDLYTGLPRYQSDRRFWSRLLAHFVNNNAVLTYLPLLSFEPPVSINGMFYVVRTSVMQQSGGFGPLLNELCDDYAVRRHATKHDWRVIQGITPQTVQTSIEGYRHYFAMMHRWMLFASILIRDQSISVQLLLTFLLGIPPVLLWCSILLTCLMPEMTIQLFGLLVARYLLLNLVHLTAFRESRALSPVLSLTAELLQPLHALHGFLVRTIRWRRHTIRVCEGNRFEILKQGEK